MSQTRQLAAILFTDIVGYTALMGRDESKAFHSLAIFKKIAQPLIEQYHGSWHKDLGDGALMSFPNVLDAVHSAIAIQKEINTKTDFHLRMGIHLGDVTFKDGDIFGDGVNIASRIQSEATPGGICISESVAKNLHNQEGMKTEYIGKRILKNVREPVALYQVRVDGLITHTTRQPKKFSLSSVILFGIAIAGVTVISVLQLVRPAKQAPLQVKRFNIILPKETPLEFIGSAPFGVGRQALAISPDGKVIVYVGSYQKTTALFSRNISSLQTELLPGTEGAYNPFFSPNGNWIGFFANDRLKKTTLDKREPTELCRASEVTGACWTIKGKIIFSAQDGSQLLIVDDAGGASKNIIFQDKKTTKTINSFNRLSILPDDNHILFNDFLNNIFVLSLETNEVTSLPVIGIQPTYIPTGHLTYLVNGSIHAIPFDLKKITISGKPNLVQEGFRLDSDASAHFGFDQSGNLIYAPGISTGLCKLVWVDQYGKEDTLKFPPDYYGNVTVSSDGKKIAYTQTGVNRDLILLGVESGRKTILNRSGLNQTPKWYSNNQNIGFSSTYQTNQTLEFNLFTLSESTGQIKSLNVKVDSITRYWLGDFSKDNNWLAFGVYSKYGSQDIWIKSLINPNQPAKPLIETYASESALRFSPNSQFITFASNSSGRYEIYVQNFPIDDKIIQVSNVGGDIPVWTASGRQVIYRNGNQWWIVDVIASNGKIQPTAPRLLFEGPYLNIPGPSFDIAPDGRLLLLKPVSEQHSTTELIVVENWFEELKRLAPPEK